MTVKSTENPLPLQDRASVVVVEVAAAEGPELHRSVEQGPSVVVVEVVAPARTPAATVKRVVLEVTGLSSSPATDEFNNSHQCFRKPS